MKTEIHVLAADAQRPLGFVPEARWSICVPKKRTLRLLWAVVAASGQYTSSLQEGALHLTSELGCVKWSEVRIVPARQMFPLVHKKLWSLTGKKWMDFLSVLCAKIS